MLRCNVVSFLAEVLCYTKDAEQEELVSAFIQQMVDMLKDQDREVRKLVSENLVRVVILSIKN